MILTCAVTDGDAPLSFSWYKDGVRQTQLNHANIDQFDYKSHLTVGQVRRHHAGNYSCTVSNAAASVTGTASLFVNGKITSNIFLNNGNNLVKFFISGLQSNSN